MQFKDYYAALGVEPTAAPADIKSHYRRLARKYHPDVSHEPHAEERFKEINEAYEALRDPQKRAAYDELRNRGYRSGDKIHQGSATDVRFEDLFGASGGHFSELFETLFAGGPAKQRSARGTKANPGQSATRAKIAVSLESVYAGQRVRVGVGGRQFDVQLPKGIRPGQVIRLTGNGPQASDILLEIDYAPHPVFAVDGRNILSTLRVAPWQAALGAVISVPTLNGPVELRIPPQSEAGRKLRLRQRGLPQPTGEPGDQIVQLDISAPKPENDAQRQAYRTLAQAFGETA